VDNCVDRLSILDGVVIATGWTDSSIDPIITLQGVQISSQTCTRYRRQDLINIYGDNADRYAFKIAAVISDEKINNSDVRILFQDGSSLINKTSVNPNNTQHQMFEKFKDIVTEKKEASLIEIGSRARSGNSYKHFFPELKKYSGIDVSEGPNVDIVADAHTLSSTITEKYDFAFSISVFEHLIMPWVAAYELNSVLKKGSLAYIQSHPAFPLHDEPWDFFRFSKEAWNGIFNELTGFKIIESGYGIEASIVPVEMGSGALQNLDKQTTYLLSACIIEKVSEPIVDWSIDPSTIYDLQYSH